MIEIPDKCPSCGSTLELVNDQLYCRNKSCPAQTLKTIQNYCKVMGIKGMGEKTLDKLAFETIQDLYEFSVQYYVDTLGETVGRKLYAQVQASCDVPANTSLAAMSVPLIGETAARKLSSVCKTIADIDSETCRAAGLGEKATSNLLAWLELGVYDSLPISQEFTGVGQVNSGKTVCITGKLRDFKNRDLAAEYLESCGFVVVDSVTKSTDVLIDEEGKTSSKRSKAEKLNIPIMSIEELVNQ